MFNNYADVIRSINMTINKNNTVPKGKSVDVVLSVDGRYIRTYIHVFSIIINF